MSTTIYTVKVLGWGDREDVFYSFGSYTTKAKAEACLEDLLKDWEENIGGRREDVEWEIEEGLLDAE